MSAILRGEGLFAGYSDAKDVVRDVSMALQPGEVVGLIGPNGAGKSTLLRILAGVLPARQGLIELDGRPMLAWARREAAQRVAFVAQDHPSDLSFSGLEVALTERYPHLSLLGMESRRDYEIAEWALASVGASRLAQRSVQTLSGGERQRVFIARGLAAEPKVLLLDEPMAHLDLGHRAELAAQLRSLAAERGCAIAIVHHDLNAAAIGCDRLVLMVDGKVQADGAVADVLLPETLSAAYGCAVQVDKHPRTGKPWVSV